MKFSRNALISTYKKQPRDSKKLTKTALGIIQPLLQYVDYDGKLHIDIYEFARLQSFANKNSVIDGFNRLIRNNLFFWKEGELYANCHMTYLGKDSDIHNRSYVRTLGMHLDGTYQSLTERQMKLVNYVQALTYEGNRTPIINIENFYKNKLRKTRRGVCLYESHRDLVNSLITIIEKGILEVELLQNGKQPKVLNCLTNHTEQLYEKFSRFLGVDKDGRKTRVGNNTTHPVRFKLSKEIAEDTVVDIGHTLDMLLIADQYDQDTTLFTSDELESLFGVKKELFKLFGDHGVKVYRQALHKYFQNEGQSFYFHVKQGKIGNQVKRYYIIPLLQESLADFIDRAMGYYRYEPTYTNSVQWGTPSKEQLVEIAIEGEEYANYLHKQLKDEQYTIQHYQYYRYLKDTLGDDGVSVFADLAKVNVYWSNLHILFKDAVSFEDSLSDDHKALVLNRAYKDKKRSGENIYASNTREERSSSFPNYNWLND
ncbi:hypothetical protein [Desertibacillus haloalkaliphilus]|uniref:hypothetical protein n=1 Tax=Desertibacillus haloalkaliphilus TaxID=1328930 RepID=UPI001C25AA78|nr:hypothetical protein [Desertibacillus haloalkaliphilus]MBU8908074.1 hypothetical protein [Desertibacillus haloalkaliphilus]